MYDGMDLKINSNYEDDIRYTVQVHRLILSLIGVWPILRKIRYREMFVRITIRAMCCFLLFFNLIPWILYMILIADTLISRLKMCGILCFYSMVSILYCALMLYENRIGECVKHVKEDWRNVRNANDRRIMLENAKSGRVILIYTTLFLFFSSFSYRLSPIIRSRIGNVTIRTMQRGYYYIFFDPHQSPAYEIVVSIHLLTGIVLYIITAAVCGITALFTMHACGQLQMLTAWLENLSDKQWSRNRTAAQKLATIITHHARIQRRASKWLRIFRSLLANILSDSASLHFKGNQIQRGRMYLLSGLLGFNDTSVFLQRRYFINLGKWFPFLFLIS